MAARRGALIGITAAAAGAGYYLYKAGGDPEVAQKKMEKDATELSAQVREQLPGKGEEIKQDAKLSAKEAGSKIDSSVDRAKDKFEDARKETGNQLNKAVDKFDKTVEEGTAKAKSGISSWFGGK